MILGFYAILFIKDTKTSQFVLKSAVGNMFDNLTFAGPNVLSGMGGHSNFQKCQKKI